MQTSPHLFQELAVRCLQRNVRAFLQVRDWPWWRLLVRVTPLLNVHRTEEQLKLANDELQMLKSKLDKLENDKNVLKTDHSRLEAKVRICTCFLNYVFIYNFCSQNLSQNSENFNLHSQCSTVQYRNENN